jgi:tyrosyl-tRNA synthetase
MSKSYDNYVGLADAPPEQYGRTMSIPDALLDEWYRLASGLRGSELAAALRRSAAEPYTAKRELAASIVRRYHGEEEARHAAEHFDLVHKEKGVPADIPLVELSAGDDALAAEAGEIWLPRLLVRVGLAPSTSQAVRLLEQGAVSVDGERAEGREARIAAVGEHVLQKGKRHFVKVVFRPG